MSTKFAWCPNVSWNHGRWFWLSHSYSLYLPFAVPQLLPPKCAHYSSVRFLSCEQPCGHPLTTLSSQIESPSSCMREVGLLVDLWLVLTGPVAPCDDDENNDLVSLVIELPGIPPVDLSPNPSHPALLPRPFAA